MGETDAVRWLIWFGVSLGHLEGPDAATGLLVWAPVGEGVEGNSLRGMMLSCGNPEQRASQVKRAYQVEEQRGFVSVLQEHFTIC